MLKTVPPFLVFLLFLPFSLSASDTPRECGIFPIPRLLSDTGKSFVFSSVHEIDVSGIDTPSSRYAQEMILQTLGNRFDEGRALERRTTDAVETSENANRQAETERFRIILESETADTREWKESFEGESPTVIPANAFRILFEENSVRILGNDANGLIYGAYALLDLFSSDPSSGKITLTAFQAVDWPSIPRRGRPHFVLMQNLTPGALDAYARGRINYVDVRDNPTMPETAIYPHRAAPMGFVPGQKIDEKNVRRVIDEAHRRAMFVYACVAAATTKRAEGIIVGFDKLNEDRFYDDVNRSFETLLALGADGLWLSFDDIGVGTDAGKAIANFLALAQKHGLSGSQLAFTPAVGAYQNIDHPINHELSRIPEFNRIQWYFTRVPCQADMELCSQMGLTLKPAWWHNLIDLRAGFQSNANIAVSLRPGRVESATFRHLGYELAPGTATDSNDVAEAETENPIPLPAYLELHPLSAGWHKPQWDAVRNASQFTDNVMLFCVGGGFPEEYLDVMFGFWAWNPENFDWARCQDSIYGWVYGLALAQTAREFDRKLVELKLMCVMPSRFFKPGENFPPHLRDVKRRGEALALLDELDALCARIQADAPKNSALNRDRLEIVYLEPMRKTLEVARFCVETDFPEYDPEKVKTLKNDPEYRKVVEAIYSRLAPELKLMDQWRAKMLAE